MFAGDPPYALGSPGMMTMLRKVRNLNRLNHGPWADDFISAALEALWQRQDRIVYAQDQARVARWAMLDECRRLLGKGVKPPIVALDDGFQAADDAKDPGEVANGEALEVPDPSLGPVELAHAAQVLPRLEALKPGWIAAILASDTLKEAGALKGRSEAAASLACTALVRKALSLAERIPPGASKPPTATPTKPARPSKPAEMPKPKKTRRADRRTPKLLEDCARLVALPGISPVARWWLRGIVHHGSYERAAAVLGTTRDALKQHVMKARKDEASLKHLQPPRRRQEKLSTLQVLADSQQLISLPGLPQRTRDALRAVVEHGGYKQAAKASAISEGMLRNHVMTARRLAALEASGRPA